MTRRIRIGIDLARRTRHKSVIVDADGRAGGVRTLQTRAEDLDAMLAQAGAEPADCDVVIEPTGLVWLPIAAHLHSRGCRSEIEPMHWVSAATHAWRLWQPLEASDSQVIRDGDGRVLEKRTARRMTSERFPSNSERAKRDRDEKSPGAGQSRNSPEREPAPAPRERIPRARHSAAVGVQPDVSSSAGSS